ncbi:MAG: hypothetical protein QOJ09_2932 [Actinomycetota bacterium]|jgi:hypothetical protein|nr:hypothetical protein [Actinomycetota bacterium]
MRRINAWLLVPAVLLALGVGTLIGRAIDDGSSTASKPAGVRSTSTTKAETSTTDTTDTTVAGSTTTTTAAPAPVAATPGTAKTAIVTATATTAKPASGATTTQAATSNSACGAGSASTSAKLDINGSGPPSDPTFTYSGPVTVNNNTGKAIEVDRLEVRITSADGTVENVPVAGAPGTIIQNGASKDFAFSHTTKHPPKDGGAQMGAFSYRAPGTTTVCAAT